MKRFVGFLLLSFLTLGLMTSSCDQEPAPSEEPGKEEQKPEEKPEEKPDPKPEDETPTGPQPGVYKFVASPLMGSWEAGDQIYVRGSYGNEALTFALSAQDISADGKTASVNLTKLPASFAQPDNLYAAWPAEAVNPYKGLIKSTSFIDTDGLLTVAYLDGDTFSFVDVSSALSFTVDGDYDHYAVCANNYDGLTYTTFTVEYSSAVNPKYSKKNAGDPFKIGTLESGKPAKMWMPGNLTFKSGITIYAGKGDEWLTTCTLEDKISLQVGETTDIGNITSSLKTFSDPGPKGLQIGERTRYKVKFNELSGLCVSAGEDFLWTVGDNGELAQISFEGELLNRVALQWGDPNGDKGGYDTEGITVNPETGDLLVSMEPNYVGLITTADQATAFASETAWNIINTLFRIKAAENYDNSGTEGITYYKDGLVYVGAQDGPADLFLCEIATGTVVERKTLGKIFPSMSEIAGLCYDPLTDWLWVVDSNSPQKFFALSGDASRILAVYLMKDTDNPESICVDHKNKCIWVGDDAGSTSYIYKYPFPTMDEYNLK